MRKYEKPQFKLGKLEASDIITVSNVFEGIAEDPDNINVIDFETLVAKENW